MITRDEADRIAQRYVDDRSEASGVECVILEKSTQDLGFGWAYFFDSKEYLDTNQFRDRLAGNWPFVVDRRDGSVHQTHIGKTLKDLVAIYGTVSGQSTMEK